MLYVRQLVATSWHTVGAVSVAIIKGRGRKTPPSCEAITR